MAPSTKKRCLLLELPAELQNMIFLLVCTANVNVRSSVCMRRVKKHQVLACNPPGLLLVNKQVHLNTLRMFYANATFQFVGHRRIAKIVKIYLDSVRSNVGLLANHQSWLIVNIRLLARDGSQGESRHEPEASMSPACAAIRRSIRDSVKAAMGPRVNLVFSDGRQ